MTRKSQVELVPRNGHTLVVGIVARISGCANQKELSLGDQVDHAKEEVAGLYQGPVDYRIIATKGKGEALDRPELAEVEQIALSRELDLQSYRPFQVADPWALYVGSHRVTRGTECRVAAALDKTTRRPTPLCLRDCVRTSAARRVAPSVARIRVILPISAPDVSLGCARRRCRLTGPGLA